MMHVTTAGNLSRAFRSSTEMAADQRIHLRRQEEERARRERESDARNDEAELLDVAMTVVAAGEVAQFRRELDRYDAATVAALQDNEQELSELRERLSTLLGQAHVLPDGRRVFKTEDGLRVFDEHGRQVDASTIDPDMIENWRPRWESYERNFLRAQELIAEREALLDYQTKLDAARESLDAGDLTREEFDRLREELAAEMPEAVRSQLPDLASEQEALDQETSLQTPASAPPVGFTVDDDMVPTSQGPAPTFAG